MKIVRFVYLCIVSSTRFLLISRVSLQLQRGTAQLPGVPFSAYQNISNLLFVGGKVTPNPCTCTGFHLWLSWAFRAFVAFCRFSKNDHMVWWHKTLCYRKLLGFYDYSTLAAFQLSFLHGVIIFYGKER